MARPMQCFQFCDNKKFGCALLSNNMQVLIQELLSHDQSKTHVVFFDGIGKSSESNIFWYSDCVTSAACFHRVQRYFFDVMVTCNQMMKGSVEQVRRQTCGVRRPHK